MLGTAGLWIRILVVIVPVVLIYDQESWPFVKTLAVLIRQSALLLSAFALAGCSARTAGPAELPSRTPVNAAATGESVRTFMQTVAHDVTQEGPLAWLRFFDAGPGFFMAVNGQLAFPNAAAADEGTKNFARTINRIELTWGDDLRVDPLTSKLAVVAASWRENQVDKAGHRTEEAGYFTGLAEYRTGRWRFRDAHWSAPVTPPSAR
jgi:hypothetical protein